MPNTEEQRLDVIENSHYLLDKVLAPFDESDDTPEGRMITQLKWLTERAENHDLALPVDPVKLSTLRYVYTNGELCRHAKIKANAWNEIEIYMDRLMGLTLEGELLYKPEYEVYAVRCIDALLEVLKQSARRLDQYEQGFIQELYQLRKELIDKTISPPIGGCKEYPNLIEVKYGDFDLPNMKELFFKVNGLIFDGVRPDSWLTPEDADRETASL